MASLKDLRLRIRSVKSTQKITSAMKMVAAAKLRRAQIRAEAARSYCDRIQEVLRGVAAAAVVGDEVSPLLAGNGRSDTYLLVVTSSDRGLAGAFNASIARNARIFVQELLDEGKTVKILCVGRKARDILRREYAPLIVDSVPVPNRGRASFADATCLSERIRAMFEAGEFDVATVIYARFRSAISQLVTREQLIPIAIPEGEKETLISRHLYEYEPSEEVILGQLLERNLSMQIFSALLESDASFQGAQMTAMDNATRNAGDLIKRLTLNYNRTRQAVITKELIEIISGAEVT